MDSKRLQSLLADGRLLEALVLLWWDLLRLPAALGKAEQFYLDDPAGHRRQTDELSQVLLNGNSLLLRNLKWKCPLALACALDRYLCDSRPAVRLAPQVQLDGQAYWVYRRRFPSSGSFSQKTGNLQFWLRHHWIVPVDAGGFRISIKAANHQVAFAASQLADAGMLRVAAGLAEDAVRPVWLERQPPAWYAEDLNDPETRWNTVRSLLEQAARNDVHLLVLPELALCLKLRRRLLQWLYDNQPGFWLVLPGSFYRAEGDAVYNHAQLLDGMGSGVLQHRKFRRFQGEGKIEGIHAGQAIELLDTPLGLLAIPICKDYCDEVLSSLWSDLGVQWVLAPSFGDRSTISAHDRMAQRMFRAHATQTVVANQPPQVGEVAESFVCGFTGGAGQGKPQCVSQSPFIDIFLPDVGGGI